MRKREFRGKWIKVGNQIVADETCKLLAKLTSEKFVRVAEREGGWTILFQDPEDQSYWELSYPESEWHGGGPPQLVELDIEQLHTLYPSISRS